MLIKAIYHNDRMKVKRGRQSFNLTNPKILFHQLQKHQIHYMTKGRQFHAKTIPTDQAVLKDVTFSHTGTN